MDRATETKLVEGAARLGLSLEPAAVAAFARYLELLLRWNARIQLTTVVDPDAVVERHFIDSLAVVPQLAGVTSLVDVGAGAGFPGVPIALLRPEMAVTVVESIHKKAAFLEALKRELGLTRLEVVADRMESLVKKGRQFEAAVSRATFAPEEWVHRGRALVVEGGTLIAMVVPQAGRDLSTWAPNQEAEWREAHLTSAYAPGRALLILRGRL